MSHQNLINLFLLILIISVLVTVSDAKSGKLRSRLRTGGSKFNGCRMIDRIRFSQVTLSSSGKKTYSDSEQAVSGVDNVDINTCEYCFHNPWFEHRWVGLKCKDHYYRVEMLSVPNAGAAYNGKCSANVEMILQVSFSTNVDFCDKLKDENVKSKTHLTDIIVGAKNFQVDLGTYDLFHRNCHHTADFLITKLNDGVEYDGDGSNWLDL